MSNDLFSMFSTSYRKRAMIGVYGIQGAGKTYLLMDIAANLCKDPNRVLVVATENSALPHAYRYQFPIRMTNDLNELTNIQMMIEQNQMKLDVFILDSLSEIWQRTRDAYGIVKASEKQKILDAMKNSGSKSWKEISSMEKQIQNYKDGVMQMQDWSKIKQPWKKFLTLMQNNGIHVLCTMRTSDVFESGEKNQFEKVGEKPKVEGETGYEFDVLANIDLVKDKNTGNKIHRLTVDKDITDTLTKGFVDFPNFQTFVPYFDFINQMCTGDSKPPLRGDNPYLQGTFASDQTIFQEPPMVTQPLPTSPQNTLPHKELSPNSMPTNQPIQQQAVVSPMTTAVVPPRPELIAALQTVCSRLGVDTDGYTKYRLGTFPMETNMPVLEIFVADLVSLEGNMGKAYQLAFEKKIELTSILKSTFGVESMIDLTVEESAKVIEILGR